MHAASSTQETHHHSYETVSSQPFPARFSLWVFSHQCDKWEFIPAGDEIFLPSLSLHPSFTASLLLFLLCILTSPSSPLLHRFSLWSSCNFPLLVSFLAFASPRRCRTSSSVRTLRDASSPRKRRCLITVISCKEIYTQRNLTCSRMSEKKLATQNCETHKKNRVDNSNLNWIKIYLESEIRASWTSSYERKKKPLLGWCWNNKVHSGTY